MLKQTLVLVAAAGAVVFIPEAAAAEKTDNSSDPNRIVCKDFPPPIGTRARPRKICKTTFEWAQIDRDQQDALDRIQRKSCDEMKSQCGIQVGGGRWANRGPGG